MEHKINQQDDWIISVDDKYISLEQHNERYLHMKGNITERSCE